MRLAPAVAIGLVAAIAIFAVTHPVAPPAVAPQAPAATIPGPRAWPDDMKATDLIEARLRDPRSAVYRNQSVEYRGDPADRIVCGEVNARNGFGGMAGYSKFLTVDQAVFMEGDDGFRAVFHKYCVLPRAGA